MPTTYTGFAFALLKPSEASPTSLTDSRVVVIGEITPGETTAQATIRFGSVATADKLLATTLLNLTDVTPAAVGGNTALLSTYLSRPVPGPGTPRLKFPLMTDFFKPSFTLLPNGNFRLQDTSGVTYGDIAFIINGYPLPKNGGVLDCIVTGRQPITMAKYRTPANDGANYHRDSTQADFNAIIFATELTPA